MAREKIDAKDKLVFDLYSGTGTITQVLAESAKKVIGVEIVEEAVESARENAKLNGIDNVEFIASDVLKVLDDLDKNPDLIVLDPPREGINPKAIDKIIDFDPEKFLYISCNPVTLVRDLGVFKERGYEIEELEIVDQFPKTSHAEVITHSWKNQIIIFIRIFGLKNILKFFIIYLCPIHFYNLSLRKKQRTKYKFYPLLNGWFFVLKINRKE